MFYDMDTPSYDCINRSSDSTHREMQFAKEDKSDLEVPEVGVDSSLRVTKSPEPIELSGALANDKTLAEQVQHPVPGDPMESVDNVDDAGIDSTRDPDWEVVEPTQLPPEPQPNQFHNDRYWEERSLDRELQDKDLQDELIKIRANDVKTVDTTGAGDTFIGYYVAGFASKMNKKDNLNRASEAAALTTIKLGGAESIPSIN